MTVAQQTVLLQSEPAAQVMTMATMHEIESARGMVELALSKVQMQH